MYVVVIHADCCVVSVEVQIAESYRFLCGFLF